jgi:hypothetical protein
MAFLSVLFAILVMTALGSSANAEERLNVELNKLESFDQGCRTFFLIRNRVVSDFTSFEMSLAILDRDGRIDRLLTVDAAPLPAERTSLKLFEIPDASCDAIGEILLYDIASCAEQGGSDGDCFAKVELGSKAGIGFVK